MNNQDLTKFEFLLTLEGNIICQRFFNVKSHVPKARRSVDLYEYLQDICDEISHDLKIKTCDYMSSNTEYFSGSEDVEAQENNTNEHFLIELKVEGNVFISRIFPAYVYHPKVRYAVDIRPNLKRILSDLTDILSSSEVNNTYLQYQL
jgi:hypothetical protein